MTSKCLQGAGVGWGGWDGMGWVGMGWDGMGWDGVSPIFKNKNCTCMAVKSQPSPLKPNSSLYSSIAKRQHPHRSKDTAGSPTYQAERERKPGGASREPWISPPFIYVSDQTYCALNSHSSQNKFSDSRHPSVDAIVFPGL